MPVPPPLEPPWPPDCPPDPSFPVPWPPELEPPNTICMIFMVNTFKLIKQSKSNTHARQVCYDENMQQIWYTLTDVITPQKANDFITWVNGQAYEKDIKTLKVFLSSTGGDMDSAIRMYYYMKALPFTVETIAFSQIDSAANLIFLAGEKRFATTDCRFFLHEPTFTKDNPTGSLHAHEEAVKIFKTLAQRQVKILSNGIEKSESDTKKLWKKARYFQRKKQKQ